MLLIVLLFSLSPTLMALMTYFQHDSGREIVGVQAQGRQVVGGEGSKTQGGILVASSEPDSGAFSRA